MDTGSSTTLLSWNEVPYATLKTNLREDRVFTGMGGSFKAFILPECSLFFYGNTGIHSLAAGDLGLSNYLTVDGRLCPAVPSVLGIDILNKFDISVLRGLGKAFSNTKQEDYNKITKSAFHI